MNLKNPIFAHLLSIFFIFGQKYFFSNNPALSRTTTHGPLTYVEFQKKLMNQSKENVRTEARKDRSMEGRTDPNS